MPRFPLRESDVLALAQSIAAGLALHGEDFPNADAAALEEKLNIYNMTRNAAEDARSGAMLATAIKKKAAGELETIIKNTLKQAEIDCYSNPTKLTELGWGPRKAPSPMEAPGQPNELEAIKEGPAVLTLSWMKAKYGGSPTSYKIERSDMPQGGGVPGPWMLLATSYDVNITLQNQPRAVEMQYRVSASNPVGDSMPSSIATVVL
jgi:hypothetical protein